MSRVVIEAGHAERNYWRDLWRYRELFYILAWRDIAIRYKQTAIGVIWALLQPVVTMVVFTVVFGKLAQLDSKTNIPYPLLVFAAMLPWQFFANSLSGSSQSLVTNSNLISKVYFPRLIVPAGAVVTAFIDFAITLFLLLAMMVYYQYMPTWRFVLLPLLIGIAFLAALGPGLLLTALNVRFRDFRFIVPFLVQFGVYVSPVGFSSDIVPEKWRLLYSMNPMVGVIDGFRWCILGTDSNIYVPGFLLSLLVVATCLAAGISYFRKTEKTFADII